MRKLLACSAVLGIAVLLTSCITSDAGTPCRYDYHCFSNSCTLGTCDSELGAALFGDDDEDDGDYSAEPPPPPEPSCEERDSVSCSTGAGCVWKRGCGFEETCSERLRRGLGCPLCEGITPLSCEAPCMWIERCERDDVPGGPGF